MAAPTLCRLMALPLVVLSASCSHISSDTVTAPGGLFGTYQNAPSRGVRAQVLILAGSGPTDRDGNGPLGLKSDTYRLLAQGLSDAGIGSTRVDKRGMFESAGASANPNGVFVTQLAQDAHIWTKEIKRKTGVQCVWLIGHSEGGLVALLAAQDPTDLCGIILLATPGQRVGETIRAQLAANPANAPILADANRALDELEAGRDVEVSNMHPALQQLYAPAVQGFWKSLLAVDPTALIAGYGGPILIVQGSTDLQVAPADARALEAAQPRATLLEIDGVNHVLKAASMDRALNLATYNNPELPIPSQLISGIANFIKTNSCL